MKQKGCNLLFEFSSSILSYKYGLNSAMRITVYIIIQCNQLCVYSKYCIIYEKERISPILGLKRKL